MARVDQVLYVAKTHLDVGFTASAAQVRERYLEDFFPRAMSVAAELRDRGGPERLRWTTGSWILTEALDAADPAHRRRLEAAIDAGDLCWHALPFTLHTEYCERSLVAHGMTLAAELDRRFERHTRAAKATDVPGHTRGLVSVLADAGVDFLHVGVNPASAAPAVPERFRWQDGPVGIDVMYQPGGYGDVQVIDGTRTAVCVDLTGDNLGPRSADEIVAAFVALADRFPGAHVRAATLDDVAAVMAEVSPALPTVAAEIGDSWIHGVGTDPQKTAGFRALCRLRRSWIDTGAVDPDDPALRRASTRLLTVGEHTWGLDLKSHWPDTTHWSVADLASVRREADTARLEASWSEQRGLLDRVVEELVAGGRGDLGEQASATLASVAPVRPDPSTMVAVDPAATIELGGCALRLDERTGAVVELVGPDGRAWVDAARPMGRFQQRTYDAADFERWFSTYNAGTRPEDAGWARWDNTKPGLDRSGAVAATWPTALRGVWSATTAEGAHALVLRIALDATADAPVVRAPEMWMTIASTDAPGRLSMELAWFDRPAARWPESSWWGIGPTALDPTGWTMSKLGESVSPFDVVDGGGRRLHVADRLSHVDGVTVDLVDTGLVAPGAPELLVWDDAPVDLQQGWHLCLHANLWGTNFPMWTEGSARFRVLLTLP